MPNLPNVKRFVTPSGVRIYRIPCRVFEYLTARVYLLLGAGPPTLVDTGSGQGQCTDQILAGLDAVRDEFGESVRPEDIRRVLITHGHVDHVGGLWQLRDRIDAEVGIHQLDRRALIAAEERAVVGKRRMHNFLKATGVEPTRLAALIGTTRYDRVKQPPVPVGIAMEDGGQLDGVRFVYTPGHAPGHVCLLIDDVLLCGDHVLARTLPQQWPESVIPNTGLARYLESLDKIRRIDGIDLTLAAHEPVISDVYKRIDTIRASQMRRLDRLVDILKDADGPLSISRIAKAMYVRATGFREILALCDVGARVEYLHQRGELVIANLDEIEAQENPVCRYVVA